MFNLKNKIMTKTLSEVEEFFSYSSQVSRLEQKDMERLFARLFLSEDGKKALAYLQFTTFQRALGVNASDQQLRYMEGQRAMVAMILRLIDRGRMG